MIYMCMAVRSQGSCGSLILIMYTLHTKLLLYSRRHNKASVPFALYGERICKVVKKSGSMRTKEVNHTPLH